MSIVTKTGDDGTTSLLFNRRVPKDHPRIEACDAVGDRSPSRKGDGTVSDRSYRVSGGAHKRIFQTWMKSKS